ncbi:ABC transporter ATP-binding protein [Plantibacter sp. VKM Ac-2885]|uniref:ABC transporter ATP-binding protein n=1 Tax=Plantibacter sp. VKM Ac-2885 TaxID=2783828 RepID=UPI00188A6BB5|nr:ABC transporter ATP-binding protein [Plantibacter sp. VKM Ac-2885]MBF4514077.1 ABC transporter ATP-binding protein [Plantibacter sp. VKM Ac-2885]
MVQANAAIRLNRVRREHGKGDGTVCALDNVDLVVPTGEYLAVVGPSGAGKSSLLNILGCLDQPTSGSLEIAGRAVSDLREREIASIRNTEIGFVFQAFNLIPSLTALGNVELPMIYTGVGRAERRARAGAALDRVGLSGRSSHRPNQLSGGQQQRVAVARAIVNQPTFILADEPTGNLDSQATDEVLAIFDELHRGGATVVVITHEDDVASRAQRVIVMRDGRIERSYTNETVCA